MPDQALDSDRALGLHSANVQSVSGAQSSLEPIEDGETYIALVQVVYRP